MFGWGIFSGVVSVASFFVGLRWGIQGVANCYAITWAAIVIPGLLIVFRLIQLRLRDFLWSFWPTLAASLGMTGLSEAWLRGLRFAGVTNSAFLLFSTAAVGAAFYVAVMYRSKPPVVHELRRVLEESNKPAILRLARFLP
jgi:PST family polysaccharide transporter